MYQVMVHTGSFESTKEAFSPRATLASGKSALQTVTFFFLTTFITEAMNDILYYQGIILAQIHVLLLTRVDHL